MMSRFSDCLGQLEQPGELEAADMSPHGPWRRRLQISAAELYGDGCEATPS
jgi:hypothetical protein